MSTRVVIPELLDHLSPDDPAARRSRRDLRRINFLMGNQRWVCRTVRRFSAECARGIVEIGAGDGVLCQKLATRFPQAAIAAYDLAPRPENADPRIAWHRGDIFESPAPKHGGVLVANLFLHHFEGPALAELGKWMSGFDVLIFNEPDRCEIAHLLGRLLDPLINHVTRHDMHVSIDAGFSHGEIAQLLELGAADWHIRETSTWRGARHVVAWRV